MSPCDHQADIPIIYVVTPTYERVTQKADLTQMANTLRTVKNLRWIIIEDSMNKTYLVTNFLAQSGVCYGHLNIKSLRGTRHRGLHQRNKGLAWIRNHVNVDKQAGVMYFGDDDNTYDVRLFEEV